MGCSIVSALDWLNVIILVAATYFAMVNLRSFLSKKHKKEIMSIKRHTFAFLTPAITFLTAGFFVKSIYWTTGTSKFPSIADIFFVISYMLFAIAFAYFWIRSAKLHKLHIKEPFFILGVASGVFIWLYYLFVTSIIPKSAGNPALNNLLDYFYPIIVSIIFLLTLVVHPRMKAKVIRTPLWYISNGVFTHFLAFMMYTYSVWNNTSTALPTAAKVIFIISAGYFILGFYTAKKKYHNQKA